MSGVGGSGRGGARSLADLWLRVCSLLVPHAERAEWLEEWRAELACHVADEAAQGSGRVRRVAGALPDALYLAARGLPASGWGGELRAALRGLARRPGFTAVTVATLALASGSAAGMFSVLEAVLLRPLPFDRPERLVRLWGTRDGEPALGGTVSYMDVHDVGERAEAIAAWAAFDEWRPAIGGRDGTPEVVYGATVNATFFDLLGVEPALGRLFREDEEGEGRELRLVLGWRLWQRLFAGDPDIVGRTVLLNGNPVEVIGVLPRSWETPGLEGTSFGAPEVWRTVPAPPAFRSARSWAGVARLRDGVTLEGAQAEVDGVAGALAAEFPEENRGWGVRLVPVREQLLGDAVRALALLSGAVVLLLLVGWANVTGLLLVRSVERRRELDVRAALGAERSRLLGVGVLESVALTAAGSLLGLGLAAAAIAALRAPLADQLPRVGELSLSPAVAALTAAGALVGGVLLGLLPGLHALRGETSGRSSRMSAARGSSAGPEAVRLRRLLVVAEVATSVVLLFGAGVLLRSLDALYRVPLGVASEGVLTASLHSSAFASLSQDEADALYASLTERLRALPAADAVGAINILPLAGGFSCDGVSRDDLPPPPPGEGRCAEVRTMLSGTLDALGIPVLRGRPTSEVDHRPGSSRVALVSEEMAEAFWPGEEPLGGSVSIHGESWEVVGVVGDVRHFGPAGTTRPQVYLPAQHDPWGGVAYGLNLVVRGAGDATAWARPLREAVREVAPDVALTRVATMEELLDDNVHAPRFRATLLGTLAVLAVALAMVGLGGLLAYSVRQRTREIGVRMALGADPGRVAALVLGEAIRLVGAGAALGLVMAMAAAGLLEGMVFSVSARDPWSLLLAPALVSVLAVAVCVLPARRAAHVDPLRALGGE